MALTIVVLAATLLAALWTVMTKGAIRAALGLAVVSVLMTILLFMLGASLAAVFELSVCAGLITVVIVSTISMTQSTAKFDGDGRGELPGEAGGKARRRPSWLLPAIVVAAGATLAFVAPSLHVDLQPIAKLDDAQDVLWKSRDADLLGQILAILAGVFGVIILFKERRK